MKTIITLLSIFSVGLLFAQPPGGPGSDDERKERLKAHKIAFISRELDLSPDEAEKFWPVYNELEGKMEEIHDEKRGYLKQLKNIDDLSESEAYSLTEKVFELEQKENNLRKEYLSKFAGVVGKKKAAKVFIAEEKFKRELLRKLKQQPRHGPRRNGPGPGKR